MSAGSQAIFVWASAPTVRVDSEYVTGPDMPLHGVMTLMLSAVKAISTGPSTSR